MLIPILGLAVMSGIQFFAIRENLAIYYERAVEDDEILWKRMNEDNVPVDIKAHILAAHQGSAYKLAGLVQNLGIMQIFIQFNMFVILLGVVFGRRQAVEKEPKGEMPD